MDLAKLAVGKLLKFKGLAFKKIGAGNLSFDIDDAVLGSQLLMSRQIGQDGY